ncbi:hypothetical protein BH20ACT19_BH20ACT19_07320 [soil metagenome]
MLRRGVLNSEQAAHHPMGAVISRCLGGERAQPDLYSVEGRPADVLLLCSDGLTGALGERRVATILRSSRELWMAAGQLVAGANESGGRDNVTVVLFRLGGTGRGVSSRCDPPTLRLLP